MPVHITILKYVSVYAASVLLMYILQCIYVNNCLHWYSFLFTSGSYTCLALEKVLTTYSYSFGSLVSVNLVHICSLAVPAITAFLSGKSGKSGNKGTSKRTSGSFPFTSEQSSKSTTAAGFSSTPLDGTVCHLQRAELLVD